MLGALISGGLFFKVSVLSNDRAIELLQMIYESASLEFYVALLSVPESEVKCNLAKHAAAIAGGLSPEQAEEPPILGPSGLGSFTARTIRENVAKYEASNASELASNCVTNTELF